MSDPGVNSNNDARIGGDVSPSDIGESEGVNKWRCKDRERNMYLFTESE